MIYSRLSLLLAVLCFTGLESKDLLAQIPPTAILESNLEYANPEGIPLLLDVIRPQNAKQPTPVVLFVHGGGWKGGDKKSGHRHAGWLADEGFAVVSINYRLTDVAQWPAQINDCYEAVRWVRRNALKYNFDGNNIAAWGTSAGGHLVALMGTRPCPEQETVSSSVQAVCDWFGPSDLLTMPPNVVGNGRTASDVAASNGAKLLGFTVRDAPDLANDASSLHHVSDKDCPFLIMHGSEDPGVPISQSRRLHNRLQKQRVASEFHVVEGAGHGGKEFQSPETRSIVRSFFTRRLMGNWPQGSGPNGNFSVAAEAVASWDISAGTNVAWRKTLPETGQSAVIVCGKRLFFSTMAPVDADSQLGSEIIAWCCHADSGKAIWKRRIAAPHPLRLSGCFSDSSAPSPVTDGERVCFFNASGRITCFDLSGTEIWSRELMPTGRSQPFLHDRQIVFTRQKYMPVKGHFTHEHGDEAPDLWTNLQALDMRTGVETWATNCGVNMGCVPLPVLLGDGRSVAVVGRGGGHSPPEKPEGISLVNLEDGATIWTLPLDGYMSTQTYAISGRHVLVFHRDEHLWVNVLNGNVERKVSILKDVNVYDYDGKLRNEQKPIPSGGKRNIIQQSNLLVGNYHYFRSYMMPYVGRIHVETGRVEYKALPVQSHSAQTNDALWTEADLPADFPKDKRKRAFRTNTLISHVGYELNSLKNSRGFTVMGDDRSQGNGWGHHASAVPSVAGANVYIPIMSGMVYVHEATPDAFSQPDRFRISHLGQVNKAWTRSTLSFGNNSVYARTISELICIRKETEN